MSFFAAYSVRLAKICRDLIILALEVIVSSGLFFGRHGWGGLFSNTEDVVELVAKVVPVVCLGIVRIKIVELFSSYFQIGDGFQGVASGVLRGMARQTFGAIVNVGVYYLIGLPLAYMLAFYFELHVRAPSLKRYVLLILKVLGLWIAITISAWIQALIFFAYIILMADWNKEAKLAVDRIKKETADGAYVNIGPEKEVHVLRESLENKL